MKSFAKKIVVSVLAWQLRRLYKKNSFKVVVVAGSLGKTSTKLAIAKVLSQKYKVQFQDGNYNDLVTVPLIFFGQKTPSLLNPLAWVKVFITNELRLLKKYPYDIVVVEVGTDGPGQMIKFKKYLHSDLTVVTAITMEHMEFFTDLDVVAAEELSVAEWSAKLLINKDLCDQKYIKSVAVPVQTYSAQDAENIVQLKNHTNDLAIAAAAIVGKELGLGLEQIKNGAAGVTAIPGRMQELAGINDSTIIDDTYNASPYAVEAALKFLYSKDAPQKIAILGSMNELGQYSESAHKGIGKYCDPQQLDLVVTIGPDANKFLAASAEAKGCKVQTFDNPYEAGEFVKSQIKPGAYILAKGSQNNVFAEEAVKLLLANPIQDTAKLVRQTPNWIKKKQKVFG